MCWKMSRVEESRLSEFSSGVKPTARWRGRVVAGVVILPTHERSTTTTNASSGTATPPAPTVRPVDLFFDRPEPPSASTVERTKPATQHMSMLDGVPVAQPASVVLEGEAATAYRGQGGGARSGQLIAGESGIAGKNGNGADQPAAGTAPSLAGMSKIRPTAGAATSIPPTGIATATATRTARPRRIVVPQRAIQGGLDAKFETDPYGLQLHGLLTARQYTEAVSAINHTIHPARASGVDTALLVTGPLLVPLAVWGVRHKSQVKKRKKLLKRAMDEFHRAYPELLMRWNRRPASCLTIERRVVEVHGPAPGMEEYVAVGGGARDMVGPAGGGGKHPTMMMGEYAGAGGEDAFV